MSAQIIVTGDKELDAKLASLPNKVQRKIARSALGKAMTLLLKEAKKKAPVGTTGALKSSLGRRFKRITRQGITQAKVGIDVGKRKSGATQSLTAPHGHLVALGTKQRFTKTGASRGRMPADDFFAQAHQSRREAVIDIMEKTIRERLQFEWERHQ